MNQEPNTLLMSELPLSPSAHLKVSEPRTANRLTLAQTFALGAWIKDHEQQAKNDPDAQCAQHAALDLSFPVTPANFTAARQALGIEKPKPSTPPTVEQRIDAVEAELLRLLQQSVNDVNYVNEVRSHLNTKIDHVERNLQMLGENCDASFKDFLQRLTALECRFHPQSDSTALPPPGRMATEIATTSDTECPTPSRD